MMFKKVTKLKYFCGVDIGVSCVKAALVKVQDEKNLDLLGVAEIPSSGFKDASVSDLTELAECITRAVKTVASKNNVNISTIHLGMSAEYLTVRHSSAVVPLIDTGSKVISRADIKKVDNQARLLGTALEEEIVHDFPQSYKVDDVNVATNPLGLYGRKIESNLLLLLVNANRMRNLIKAVHQAGFEVSDVSLSSYAASLVSVEETLRNQGCVLVDIGSNTTTALFFKNGILGDIQSIPWGGNYLTQSLAERLGLAADLAEDIKKVHAVASANAAKEEGEILIKRERGFLPIRKEKVCEAVNWEVENLLTHLEAVIKGSPLFYEINSGVVMIGGGALMPGLMERVENRLKMPVSLGNTKGLNHAALFAGAIGLAQMSYYKNKKEALDLRMPVDMKNKVFERVKELCQEYF